MSECGEAAPGVGVGHGPVHGGGLAEKHHAAASASDSRVEEIALEKRFGRCCDRDDDVGEFAALRAVNRQRIGVEKFIEVAEGVGHGFAVVQRDGEFPGFGVDGGDGAGGAVEDAGAAAVRLVADLQDTVAETEDDSPVVMLRPVR